MTFEFKTAPPSTQLRPRCSVACAFLHTFWRKCNDFGGKKKFEFTVDCYVDVLLSFFFLAFGVDGDSGFLLPFYIPL